MGNENFTKDPNVSIFLQLKSLIYRPQQKLKGCVYLEVKQYSKYSQLILRIECYQRTQSNEKKDKNKELLTQEKRTYLQQLSIESFMNGLYQGNHQFPFGLIIPQGFPGTVVFNSNNYLKYRLTAYLQSSQPSISNQIHYREIWIIQNFRGTIQPLFSRKMQESKCCMWGYSYGNMQTQIECQSNCVNAGQKMKIKFQINTKRMNSPVKLANIKLIEKNVMIIENIKQEKQVSQLFSFDFNQISIPCGQTKLIQKSIQFPVDLFPTSIGQNIARYYIVKIQLFFSCYSQLTQQLHIFVNSQKNNIEQNKPFIKPRNWKCMKYKKKQFKQLKKYVYLPSKSITFCNRYKENGVNNLDLMRQQRPMSSRRLIK